MRVYVQIHCNLCMVMSYKNNNRILCGIGIGAVIIINLAILGISIFLIIDLTENQNEFHCNCENNPSTPEVILPAGVVKGIVIPSTIANGVEVEQFAGIPFALPPVGARRFADPVASGNYPGGVLEAYEGKEACLQIDGTGPPEIGPVSEDCLYLNVWRPRPVRSARAVMVWIYGGGFNVGSASISSYNATFLSSFGDVIVVGMNYRLNIFGFFHTGDDRIPSGNFGLKDQQLALSWVQENIAYFGGDPNLVTIFGSSAGGASVAHLLNMPGSDGLFTRAIMQSGDSITDWAYDTMEIAALTTDALANVTKCENDETLLDCLREISGMDLLQQRVGLGGTFAPIVDFVTIPDYPENLVENGKFVRKDVMIGYVKDEGNMFVYFVPGVTPSSLLMDPYGTYVVAAEFIAGLRNLSQEEISEIIAAYEPADNTTDEVKIAIGNMCGDFRFVCPGEMSAKAFNKYGMKVYQYLLTRRSTFTATLYPEWYGVPHGDDIQWIFGWPFYLQESAGHEWTDDEKTFTLELMQMWVNFAKYGNPDETWTTYTNNEQEYIELKATGDFPMFSNSSRPGLCALWRF